MCIVRVERNVSGMFQQMIPFITEMREGKKTVPCTVRVLHVSGSLSKCKGPAVEYQLKLLRELQLKESQIKHHMKTLVELDERVHNM